MAVLEKLKRLGAAAAWDSCGGMKQKSLRKNGIPSHYSSFVHDCSATSEQCRFMKVLQTNSYIHDCRYCVNSSCKKARAELASKELAKSFARLNRAGHVNGLFLSSAVQGEADRTAEKVIENVKILRQKFGFRGWEQKYC